jgi:hypothetical protein
MNDQPAALISVLLDPTARSDERDDAAMDLADYDAALPTLIVAARNHDEHETVAASLGAAIGEIWTRIGGFDIAIVETLHPQARSELLQRFEDNGR